MENSWEKSWENSWENSWEKVKKIVEKIVEKKAGVNGPLLCIGRAEIINYTRL